MPVFKSLTREHMYLNASQKMRNKLAEDCLGKDMLHLMKVRKSYTLSKGQTSRTLGGRFILFAFYTHALFKV